MFFPPTTTHNGLLPLSTNGDLPLSMNGRHPPSLALASSLSRAGILPLSCWHHPSFDEWLPSTFDNNLVLPLADGLPCLDEQLPPSFDKQLPTSLDKQFLPLADGLTPPSTNCLPLPSANSPLLDGQSHPSTNALLPCFRWTGYE